MSIQMNSRRDDECGYLLEVTLKDGRRVTSSSYDIEQRGGLILEGRFIASEKEFQRTAAADRWGGWPAVVIDVEVRTLDDGSVEFPLMTFSTRFSSAPIEKEFDTSELVVVWYQDHAWPPISDTIRAAMAEIDWNVNAKGGVW